MTQLHIALIGDIIESKKINDRAQFQLKFKKCLDDANAKYSNFINAKFLITLGDEFQGLLKPNAPIYEIINFIVDELYPVSLRFGLGFGDLNTEINDVALGMDGPAFNCARDAINVAHKKRGYSIVFKSYILDKYIEEEINLLFDSLCIIRKLWTNRFLEIVKYFRNGQNQSGIADTLNVSQPAISKIIKSSYWDEVENIEKKLSLMLRRCFVLKSNDSSY